MCKRELDEEESDREIKRTGEDMMEEEKISAEKQKRIVMLNQAIRAYCEHQNKRNITTSKRIRNAFASGYLSALSDFGLKTTYFHEGPAHLSDPIMSGVLFEDGS